MKGIFSLSSIFRFDGGFQANESYSIFVNDECSGLKLSEKPTKKEINPIKMKFKEIEDFMVFQFNLNKLSIQFKPVHGASQDYDNESGKDYSKMVKAIYKETNEFIKKSTRNMMIKPKEDSLQREWKNEIKLFKFGIIFQKVLTKYKNESLKKLNQLNGLTFP